MDRVIQVQAGSSKVLAENVNIILHNFTGWALPDSLGTTFYTTQKLTHCERASLSSPLHCYFE